MKIYFNFYILTNLYFDSITIVKSSVLNFIYCNNKMQNIIIKMDYLISNCLSIFVSLSDNVDAWSIVT